MVGVTTKMGVTPGGGRNCDGGGVCHPAGHSFKRREPTPVTFQGCGSDCLGGFGQWLVGLRPNFISMDKWYLLHFCHLSGVLLIDGIQRQGRHGHFPPESSYMKVRFVARISILPSFPGQFWFISVTPASVFVSVSICVYISSALRPKHAGKVLYP